MTTEPISEYTHRLNQRRASHTSLSWSDVRLAWARLAVFAVAAVLAFFVLARALTVWWLLIPVAGFVVLVIRHDRVLRARDAAARAMTFYMRGLARLEDRWHGTGEAGERFKDDRHLYAHDLDLFGPGSLFELLSIARTRPGEATLAHWLKTPATPTEISARHEAIRELTLALDLRESLSLAGSDVRAGVDGDGLVAWAQRPPILSPSWLRGVAVLVTIATLASAVASVFTESLWPFVTMLMVQSIFSIAQAQRITRALHTADGPARDLDVLSHLLGRLERETFSCPKLAALRRQIEGEHMLASVAIRRLHRFMEMHDWQHNTMFAPFAIVLMWGTHLAWAIERWRLTHGARIAEWLRAVGEFEALASLSAYRYEHPADPFPQLVASNEHPVGPLFDGAALGHPLLPAARGVRNDVCLSRDQRLLIVSGSNMSGKSTLLRTVGVNAVLALAGAPVRATSLSLSPLNVGATLRIQDSLQEGRSRFYAEITRIRELAALRAEPTPLLFLLDELFQGTNSRDRLVGASSVLRSFIGGGAIGLITTHDLALTSIADELSPHAANVHFDDWFEDGEMRFDYTVKPGPVTRSNAIALMKAVGLDV